MRPSFTKFLKLFQLLRKPDLVIMSPYSSADFYSVTKTMAGSSRAALVGFQTSLYRIEKIPTADCLLPRDTVFLTEAFAKDGRSLLT